MCVSSRSARNRHTKYNIFFSGNRRQFLQVRTAPSENFLKAARDAGHDEVQVRVRSQEGYDHSYYFVRPSLSNSRRGLNQRKQISTFASDHVHCEFRPTRRKLSIDSRCRDSPRELLEGVKKPEWIPISRIECPVNCASREIISFSSGVKGGI